MGGQQHTQDAKQMKSSPWGHNKNDNDDKKNNNIETTTKASMRSSLQTIMKEQQEGKEDFLKNENMKDVDDDEAMRLAVEASLLYDIASKKVETSAAADNQEEDDDDLKLAMKLSLNDVKIKEVVESTSTNNNAIIKSSIPLKDDPKYANYFLMKNVMNVDVIDIKQLMKIDGIDDKILDLDPNQSLDEQLNKKKKKVEVDSSYEIALQLQREEDQSFAM